MTKRPDHAHGMQDRSNYYGAMVSSRTVAAHRTPMTISRSPVIVACLAWLSKLS